MSCRHLAHLVHEVPGKDGGVVTVDDTWEIQNGDVVRAWDSLMVRSISELANTRIATSIPRTHP